MRLRNKIYLRFHRRRFVIVISVRNDCKIIKSFSIQYDYKYIYIYIYIYLLLLHTHTHIYIYICMCVYVCTKI